MNLKRLLICMAICTACAGVANAAQQNRQGSVFKAPGGVEIRAALSYSEEWDETPFPYGIYSINAVEGAEPEFYFLTDDRNMEGGAVYVDGVIHAISKVGTWLWDDEDEGWYFEQKGTAFTSYDAETGEVLFDTTEGLSSDLYTSDLCYDATTGNIYGVFKVNGYQNAWGILDIDNLTVEYINSKMSTGMSAIAADASGVIYGVTSGGNLVTIDKATGEVSAPLAEYKKYQGYKSTGVIDNQTNTFYWLLNSYGDAGLYSIDLNTYELTKIQSFRNLERWGGAYIPQVIVDEGTPAAATNLVINFQEGSLTGTVTFDASSESVDYEDLTGTTLGYALSCDNEVIATGEVAAGSTITTDAFTVTGGYHEIKIVLSNEMGEGIPAKTTYWFGNDAPANVNDIIATNDKYTVNISWSAPTASLHNGYFNADEVTYKITRMPEDLVVAENLKETSFTDEISSKKVAKYFYKITPSFDGLEGRVAETPALIIGEGVNLPYESYFEDEDCELMTIEDSNGDGNTWDIGSGGAIYRFGDVDADDWIFTAPLYLETGTAYSIFAQLESGLSRQEKFEIKLGKASNASAMDQTVVEPTEFESSKYETNAHFTVSENGTYFIGFHALSPESHFALWITHFLIETAMSEEAPAAGKIKATAGEKGAKSATLAITAPTERYNGKQLEGLEGANIFHNGSLIDSMDDIEPGKTYTYVHEGCDEGVNNYSVVFVNENGNGMPCETNVFVGKDLPLAPKNAHFTIEDGKAVLTWDAPGERGVNGGYVDPEKVVYSICYTDNNGEWQLMDDTSDCKASVNVDTTGKQRWFLFGLMAYNDLGESDAVYSNAMIIGDKYEMPYLESLDNGVNKTMFSSINLFDYRGGYSSDINMSASETGGCLYFRPHTLFREPPFIDTLTTGVINTSRNDEVTVSFYYYNDEIENNGDELTVALYDQDNDITYNLGSVKMDGSATEWRKYEATKKISSDNLRIHIGITSNNGNLIYLDEFKLETAGTVGVGQICGEGVKVMTGNGEITIVGLNGENVAIASANGMTLYNGIAEGEISVVATPGIYVVKVADRSVKVVVK